MPPEASLVGEEVLRAYRETAYRVRADPPFVLTVDARSPELAAEHARQGVAASAFVTACNPFGRLLGARENARRHAALGRALLARGAPCVEGVGAHPDGRWPGEPSYLVFGTTAAAARALGARLEQNALLWSGPDAVPRLVLLR